MDVIYFFAGMATSSAMAYVWYLIGRNTSYQDKNIIPPPAPIAIPKIETSKEPDSETKPVGWVDETTDPGMIEFHKGREL